MDRGEGLAADPVGAQALLRDSCGDDSPISCGILGQILARQPSPDPAEVLALVNRACVDGVGRACAAQAGMYALGELVPVDFVQVSALEQRACDLGVSNACMVEAEVAQRAADYSRSAEYYEKACYIGDPEGCGMLAGQMQLGLGMDKNLQIHARPQRWITGQMQLGLGMDKNPDKASALMTRSCWGGFGAACVDLVKRGEPLPLSPKATSEFLTSACDGGVVEACPH